jgi:uncharacterized protein (TIGR03437 family)
MKDDTGQSTPSLLDGRLVRLLDGEVSAEERAELLELLESSPEARARYDELRAVSSRLSHLLEQEATPPVPDLAPPQRSVVRGRRSGARVWLQLAAGVVLLLAVGLTVEPVRAWLTTGVQRVVELFAPQESDPAAEDLVTPEQGTESPSTVRFLPADPVFAVEVRSPQPDGVLIVESVSDGGEVTASVVAGAGETLVVLPSGLGITNTAESTADYRVSVPSRLTSVEVRIDGVVVATLSPGDPPGRWEIPLDRP